MQKRWADISLPGTSHLLPGALVAWVQVCRPPASSPASRGIFPARSPSSEATSPPGHRLPHSSSRLGSQPLSGPAVRVVG